MDNAVTLTEVNRLESAIRYFEGELGKVDAAREGKKAANLSNLIAIAGIFKERTLQYDAVVCLHGHDPGDITLDELIRDERIDGSFGKDIATLGKYCRVVMDYKP